MKTENQNCPLGENQRAIGQTQETRGKQIITNQQRTANTRRLNREQMTDGNKQDR